MDYSWFEVEHCRSILKWLYLGYVVIIDSPTISPELSSKEKVREGNDDKKDNKV